MHVRAVLKRHEASFTHGGVVIRAPSEEQIGRRKKHREDCDRQSYRSEPRAAFLQDALGTPGAPRRLKPVEFAAHAFDIAINGGMVRIGEPVKKFRPLSDCQRCGALANPPVDGGVMRVYLIGTYAVSRHLLQLHAHLNASALSSRARAGPLRASIR